MFLYFILTSSIVSGVIQDKDCTEGQNPNLQFSWRATDCKDKFESCKEMFPYDQANNDRAGICFKKPTQKQFALETCPKTCRFCCLTPRFNCQDNAASPYPCQLVTKELCQLKEMRDFLVKNCPSKCGFCQENGKEEGGGEEGKDCPADNKNCVDWVKNGFCDSTFYTLAQKKQTCGHACKLC